MEDIYIKHPLLKLTENEPICMLEPLIPFMPPNQTAILIIILKIYETQAILKKISDSQYLETINFYHKADNSMDMLNYFKDSMPFAKDMDNMLKMTNMMNMMNSMNSMNSNDNNSNGMDFSNLSNIYNSNNSDISNIITGYFNKNDEDELKACNTSLVNIDDIASMYQNTSSNEYKGTSANCDLPNSVLDILKDYPEVK